MAMIVVDDAYDQLEGNKNSKMLFYKYSSPDNIFLRWNNNPPNKSDRKL